MPEWLTSRRMYFVVVVVVLMVLVLIVVALTRTSWTLLGWTALAAVAASLQAIGVLTALVFAWVQINSARAESRRQRQDQLIDELGTTTFRTLAAAVRRHLSAWRMALYYKESAATFDKSPLGNQYAERYRAHRGEVQESDSQLHAAIEDVNLVMLRLGKDGAAEFAQLQAEALHVPSHLLPIKPTEVVALDTGVDFTERLSEAATGFEQWVRSYIRQHVSSE